MCNYQKKQYIWKATLHLTAKISKILFQKGLGPTKIKIKKFIKNHRRPADFYVWCYFISMRVKKKKKKKKKKNRDLRSLDTLVEHFMYYSIR